MVAIALILAAVFVPTVFIPGITGRLYQQFALTIAISVIFSAFNALSLSPALFRPAAQAQRANAQSPGRLLRLVQPRLWTGQRWLCQLERPPHSPQHPEPRSCWPAWRPWPFGRDASCPPRFCPRRTRATCTSMSNFPTRPPCREPTPIAEGGGHTEQDTRHQVLYDGARFQPVQPGANNLQRLFFRHPQAMG